MDPYLGLFLSLRSVKVAWLFPGFLAAQGREVGPWGPSQAWCREKRPSPHLGYRVGGPCCCWGPGKKRGGGLPLEPPLGTWAPKGCSPRGRLSWRPSGSLRGRDWKRSIQGSLGPKAGDTPHGEGMGPQGQGAWLSSFQGTLSVLSLLPPDLETPRASEIRGCH